MHRAPSRALEHGCTGGLLRVFASCARPVFGPFSKRSARVLACSGCRGTHPSGTFRQHGGLWSCKIPMRGHVSESNEHPDDLEHDALDPETSAEAAPDEPGPEADDDDDDLDGLGDLDDLDVDGVVAQLSSDKPRKRARPVWVSAVVMLACLYPLVSMWGDFRFWLRSSDPEPLGDAAALFEAGKATPDLADRYVSIEGTPDVQWATVLTKKSGAKVTYLRVLEGGGKLFAAVPRPEGIPGKTPEYPSHFVGRVTRFGDAPTHDWIARLFAQEGVAQLYDVAPEQLASAIAAGEASLRLTAEDGQQLEAEATDALRIIVRPDDARVLLGAETFPDAKAAEAAVAALGYPYLSLGEGRTDLHRYVVRIPTAERDKARASLLAAAGDKEIDANDPKEGVSVFPLTSMYTAAAGELTVQGDAIAFPYGDNTTAPGYVERDGRLVEASLEGGRMVVPLGHVHAARVEKPVFVDPDGFLIEVDVAPGDQLKWGILWLLVLGLALTNAVVLYGSLRRRAV